MGNVYRDRPDLGEGVRQKNDEYWYGDTYLGLYTGGPKSGEWLKDDARFQNKLRAAQNASRESTTNQLSQSLYQKQQELADQFKQNIPKYTGLLQDKAKREIHTNLAQKMADLKQQSANRGFLKGSGTQRQRAESVAKAGSDVATSDFNVAQDVQSQAQNLENQALASKLAYTSGTISDKTSALRDAIANQQAQNEMWKSLGQAGGQVAGAYAAKKGS